MTGPIVQLPVSSMASGTERHRAGRLGGAGGGRATRAMTSAHGVARPARRGGGDQGVAVEPSRSAVRRRADRVAAAGRAVGGALGLRQAVLHIHFPVTSRAAARAAGPRRSCSAASCGPSATRSTALRRAAASSSVAFARPPRRPHRVRGPATATSACRWCGRPLDKCVVIPNGVDPTRSPTTARRRTGPPSTPSGASPTDRGRRRPKVGAYDPRQGVLDFVRAGAAAAAATPVSTFVVIGECAEVDEARRIAARTPASPTGSTSWGRGRTSVRSSALRHLLRAVERVRGDVDRDAGGPRRRARPRDDRRRRTLGHRSRWTWMLVSPIHDVGPVAAHVAISSTTPTDAPSSPRSPIGGCAGVHDHGAVRTSRARSTTTSSGRSWGRGGTAEGPAAAVDRSRQAGADPRGAERGTVLRLRRGRAGCRPAV